jgi:hypothetical protein
MRTINTQKPLVYTTAIVARAAKIRAQLMRDSDGSEDLSLPTIAVLLKQAHKDHHVVDGPAGAKPASIPIRRVNAPMDEHLCISGFEPTMQM